MNTKEIYLAGGCYWGVEHLFSQLAGVVSTEVGFANGHTHNPTYEQVYTDQTGFAETVHVCYDADRLRLYTLLHIFFDNIDPTLLNQQGEDHGTRYRTGIYPTTDEDLKMALLVRDERQEESDEPIVVEVEKLQCFFKAEENHQQYLVKNPTGYCHISLEAFKRVRKLNQKVYFAGSIRGGRDDKNLYKHLIQRIERYHRVLTEHVGNLSLSHFESGKDDALIYQQDVAWIAEADVLIAECTTPSLGVGYELAYAERLGKPCYVLFDCNRCQLSAMIGGNSYFKQLPYHGIDELFRYIDGLN